MGRRTKKEPTERDMRAAAGREVQRIIHGKPSTDPPFTGGKWRAVKYPQGTWGVRNELFAIANCVENGEEDEANAKLIASAPSLLSALQTVVTDIDALLAWMASNGKTNSEVARIGREAKAALSKAGA